METIELKQGKIYFLDYGGNTQVIGRYINSDAVNYYFESIIHYWNGFETFKPGKNYCVKNGIELMRPASKPEKHTLVKFEIEHEEI
jgi:hypothetical protein